MLSLYRVDKCWANSVMKCTHHSVFSLIQEDSGTDKENSVLPPGSGVPSAKNNEENMIDNPYLRPVKKPKVRRKK